MKIKYCVVRSWNKYGLSDESEPEATSLGPPSLLQYIYFFPIEFILSYAFYNWGRRVLLIYHVSLQPAFFGLQTVNNSCSNWLVLFFFRNYFISSLLCGVCSVSATYPYRPSLSGCWWIQFSTEESDITEYQMRYDIILWTAWIWRESSIIQLRVSSIAHFVYLFFCIFRCNLSGNSCKRICYVVYFHSQCGIFFISLVSCSISQYI